MPRHTVRAQELQAGQDPFHHPPRVEQYPVEAPSGPGGRPRYKWAAYTTLLLIILVIHTDITFDDIPHALRDETDDGPCESTCREYWHRIFGYSPQVARLQNPAGREARHQQQCQACPRNQLARTVDHSGVREAWKKIEDKAGYPDGFIAWLRGMPTTVLRSSAQSRKLTGGNEQRSWSAAHDGREICGVLARCEPNHDHALVATTIELLLQQGGSANDRGPCGETALHHAVRIGNIAVVTMLLEHGADASAMTADGESIWDFGNRSCQDLLSRASELRDDDLLPCAQSWARIAFARTTVRFNPTLFYEKRSTFVQHCSDRTSNYFQQPGLVVTPRQPRTVPSQIIVQTLSYGEPSWVANTISAPGSGFLEDITEYLQHYNV